MGDAIPFFNLEQTLRDRSKISKEVADVAAIRALVSTGLTGGEIVMLANGILYVFVSTDAGADDGNLILTPTDSGGNGRWRKSAILAV